jgi:flagellin
VSRTATLHRAHKVGHTRAEEWARCDGSTPQQQPREAHKNGSTHPGNGRNPTHRKENPMSLGVLNNLSAMYAANNLSNTQNSLSKTLQQLSSGSKINSGADDAAGLSLVNGLMANSTALAQSQTNAQEGVGLLQVADGALSQVTNLLNRAVTLATEVSNGTLNGSQQSAANQEYQSILSEINNIGSTSTYNQKQVFTGSTVDVYTGDSSTSGASIDRLNFAKLTSSSVGDAGGTVQQSSAGSYYDLSKDTAGALTTGAAQIDNITGGFKFTTTNPDGTTTNFTTSALTVSGLISEINSDGISGVTASFATASTVGDGGVNSGDTGILLTNTNASVAITTTVKDTTTGITPAAFASTAGTATIQYVANAAGDTTSNLSLTDLTSQANAETALTTINAAISNVAAQDGYIGAQINTLNAVSQVLSTQKENVVAAQNAVQATDYATAASNMSKYQILSQTGISALAQANSMSQLVTKLLQ